MRIRGMANKKIIQIISEFAKIVLQLQREAWDDIKEYKENFKEVIKEREKNRIPFFHQSPQTTMYIVGRGVKPIPTSIEVLEMCFYYEVLMSYDEGRVYVTQNMANYLIFQNQQTQLFLECFPKMPRSLHEIITSVLFQQFTYRGHLVEYLKRICIEKNLTHCCLHLAVYLLDIFMDNHSIVPERVLLVTNVCLLISAKFEENNVTIPKIAELNAAINNRYPMREYKNLEIVMLKFFHWYIMFPTAAHYIFYYMQSIISIDDLGEKNSIRSLFFDLHHCITDYLDQIIDNVHYMQCYPPSKLAAAIISASRMDMGLTSWTEELQNLTNYKMEDVQAPTFVLKTKHAFVHCQKCKIENLV